MPVLLKLVLIVLCAYGLFLAWLHLMQRKMIYFPDTSRPETNYWQADAAEVITVHTKDGLDLSGWYFPPKNPGRPVILYFHGNAQNHAYRFPRVQPYLEQGMGVLLAGYRGYGGNPSFPSEKGLYNDAHAYMDYLTVQKNINLQSIILYGESLGTGVAVQMATEYDVKALILEAPYTSFMDVARSFYPYVPVHLLMKDRFPSIEKIGRIKAPVLIIHGERDEVIPSRNGRILYEAAPNPKKLVLIPEAGHNNLEDYGLSLHITEFLSTMDARPSPLRQRIKK